MRRPVLLVAIAILVASIPTGGAHGVSHVVGAGHDPPNPVRGEAVALTLELDDPANVTGVEAIYCRVEGYACAPALAMTDLANGNYHATIPWTPRFFDGVRTVGYRFIIHFRDGTTETSPLVNQPYTPAKLPADADTYYFYALPAESPAPTAGLLGLIGIGVWAIWRRSP